MLDILQLVDKLAGRWLDWRADRAIRQLPPGHELKLHRIDVGADEWKAVVTAPAVFYFAEQAAKLLNLQNAKNYVQFDMMPRIDRGLPPTRVTIQWAHGESPAAKAARLERELAAALGDKGWCGWIEEGEYWSTSCEQAFTLIDGTPTDNNMCYCPFCGRVIIQGFSDTQPPEAEPC